MINKKVKIIVAAMGMTTLLVGTVSYATEVTSLNAITAGVATILEGNETSYTPETPIASISGATLSTNEMTVSENVETNAVSENEVMETTVSENTIISYSELITQSNVLGGDVANVSSVDGMIDYSLVANDPLVTVELTAGAGNGVVETLEVKTEEEQSDEASDNAEEDNAGSNYGYTNLGIANVADHLNVRATADGNSKLVGKMSNATACELLDIEGNMAHITSGSVEGYVSLDYLLTGDAAKAKAAEIIQKLATVTADGLKLRENPSADAPVVGLVAYGEELVVVEETQGWVKVLYDQAEVYVSSEFVSVDTKLKTALNMSEFLYGSGVSDVRVDLCEYAKQFLGNRYVWGGTSLTKGADCSGFTLSIMKKYGITLPHSAAAQSNMGTKITMAEARPGDLVFYAKGGRVNHVAIYIGGGQVIHASSPKTGIRISGAYYRTPVAVRRFIQD